MKATGERWERVIVAESSDLSEWPRSVSDPAAPSARRAPGTATGKLVGAVTHVLVNDPTMGYGIFIENMLSAAA